MIGGGGSVYVGGSSCGVVAGSGVGACSGRHNNARAVGGRGGDHCVAARHVAFIVFYTRPSVCDMHMCAPVHMQCMHIMLACH